MKKILKNIFYVSFILLVFIQCAKRGTPTGGPEDELPPEFIRATPENFSTNFNSEEIRIYFDEYVKLNNAQKQIIISPPMDPRPTISPLGTASKYVKIVINDTLQENTTYVINFGRSVVDNNAENPLPFFKYVFSTGNTIDSLTLSGEIKDAFNRVPETFISVMLYEVDSLYNDSIIYNEVPRYVTNTLDSTTTFQLTNLRAGTYKLIALQDKNNNYKYDPSIEKIAYEIENIEIPSDSYHTLELFSETPEFAITKPTHIGQQHLIFGFEGDLTPESLAINPISTPGDYVSRIIKDEKTDTLHYFYKPEIEADSLIFDIRHETYRDTTMLRLKELEKDSLILSVYPKGELNFNDSLYITGNTPIRIQDETHFKITDNDSLPVPFTTALLEFENKIFFDFEKKENEIYRFEVLPGAISDFFNSTNDSISASLRTKEYSDYGNLYISIQNLPEHPVILQMSNEKGEVIMEKIGTGQNDFQFKNLKASKYYLRIIFDENGNQRWDSGNFIQKIQPEKVVYFPKELDIRANWDVSEVFILE